MLALVAAAAIAVAPGPVVYVGDSLGVGTLPALVTRMPAVSFEGDARVGRNSAEGLGVLRARLRLRHRVVIFDLGTNDPAPGVLERNLRAARRTAGDRLMVVFTINKPGAAPFNRVIRRFAAGADTVELLDWRALAARERLLGPDGIHAAPAGYRRRAALVAGWLGRSAPRTVRFRAGRAS
jgi:hypothetical protein